MLKLKRDKNNIDDVSIFACYVEKSLNKLFDIEPFFQASYFFPKIVTQCASARSLIIL